jgi:hypothetical protein
MAAVGMADTAVAAGAPPPALSAALLASVSALQ